MALCYHVDIYWGVFSTYYIFFSLFFFLPITFSRVQKFDRTSSMNTENFKKDVPDNHVHISLAFQLLDMDRIFRFRI